MLPWPFLPERENHPGAATGVGNFWTKSCYDSVGLVLILPTVRGTFFSSGLDGICTDSGTLESRGRCVIGKEIQISMLGVNFVMKDRVVDCIAVKHSRCRWRVSEKGSS